MDHSAQNIKKQLYLKQTPIMIEIIIKEVINKQNDSEDLSLDLLSRLKEIEESSYKFKFPEIAHIVKVLRSMLIETSTNVKLPRYMEQSFLQLLDEIVLFIQTPTQIQYRLPKVKNEKLFHSVKEYNSHEISKTILLIDGDFLFLNKTARLFVEAGFNVMKAHRFEQGLHTISETLPDCIILGLNLIDIKPEKFIANLQSETSKFFVPTIVVGDKTNKDVLEKLKFHVEDVIEKPFVMDDLYIKVMRLIDQSEKMKNQVNIDELTSCYSRKFIMERLEYFYCNQKEKDNSHALAIIDLDYFKHVNDQYGHPIGDKVLIQFAKFITEKIRNTDIFARYGGEEFILLFPHTETKDALKKLDFLREEFSKLNIDTGDSFINQTFSGGIVSNKDVCTNNPVEILNWADIALYAAKNSGRNRLLMYDPKMVTKKQAIKVLIADDDRFIRQVLIDGLNDQKWDLLVATNGREALDIANSQIPNLIILDGSMPEIDGYEVLSKLRNNIRFKQTGVIMLTGNSDEKNIAKALEAGADDYITKPFSLVELKARINRLLMRH